MTPRNTDGTEDPEVRATTAIVSALAGLDKDAQKRILEYAIDRYVRTHPTEAKK